MMLLRCFGLCDAVAPSAVRVETLHSFRHFRRSVYQGLGLG